MVSVASAVPASVYSVSPYVFLAPELPKFSLQPTLKVQSAPVQPIQSIQPVSNAVRSDPAATKQYVLVYPTYQYIGARQDSPIGSGFFQSIQSYFTNFGQTQNDESSQIMDEVEPDKTPIATEGSPILATQEKLIPVQNEIKSKFLYSYATPASTVPLKSDRRFFLFPEQSQVLSTYSGSAINPILTLQPVPVLVARSNIAQSDDQQPGKVVSENVQKYSQIPPVMNSIVEQAQQVQVKSVSGVHTEAIAVDGVAENRVAPAPAPVGVDNRAIPIPTEPTVEAVVTDQSKSLTNSIVATDAVASPATAVPASIPAVVVARSNAIPLSVSSESVSPIVASPVIDSSVVQAVIEGNESGVQQSVATQSVVEQSVVGPSLKEVQPVAQAVQPVVPSSPAVEVPASSPANAS